jgi:hypothetical protein
MSDYGVIALVALLVGAAGALCIFSAYDIGFHLGRKAGRAEEQRRRWWSGGAR